MPINLTRVFYKTANIKNKLFYPKNTSAKFYKGNILQGELTTGFFISTHPTSNLAIGEEYFEMSVTQPDVDLNEILLFATVVEVNGEKYEIKSFFRPRALTEKWELRLQSLGNRSL